MGLELKGKTADKKFKLNGLAQFLESLGAEIKKGKKHVAKAVHTNWPYSCALGPSTSFRDHVLPWIPKIAPQYLNNKQKIYDDLRSYA